MDYSVNQKRSCLEASHMSSFPSQSKGTIQTITAQLRHSSSNLQVPLSVLVALCQMDPEQKITRLVTCTSHCHYLWPFAKWIQNRKQAIRFYNFQKHRTKTLCSFYMGYIICPVLKFIKNKSDQS